MFVSRRHVALNMLHGCTQTFTVRFRRGNYGSADCGPLGAQIYRGRSLSPSSQLQLELSLEARWSGTTYFWQKRLRAVQGSVPCCAVPLLCPAERNPFQGLVILIYALGQSCRDGFLILHKCFCYKRETIWENCWRDEIMPGP